MCGAILKFNLRHSSLHYSAQQLLKSASRRSKNQNVNFSGDKVLRSARYSTIDFSRFCRLKCEVNVRSVVNYMAGAMISLSARCGKG